ncbi:MATE family efflux transporter [Mesobacillus maritimus]|uniref:MATE family efflux transporter n=1 Tax=Mesobacillus maritimus TaxID=1643336 RepID=UPI00203AFD77|nr:MATE family efflux transporter [Mesobacillus maritimus]MCM3587504.1 MATE family efflux transporter [Mesobacillus maritimus]MCM3671151.1 MATE family efflux transporter [Mesobacillus maritimus]
MREETTNYKTPTLFQISWPLFIEFALHMSMGIIATFMLGHYSDHAAAGVGVANQLLNIFIIVFNVTSIGATILIGQKLGANELGNARKMAHSAFGMNFWFGIIVAIIIFFFGEYFLRLFNIEGKIFEYGLIFLKICGLSLFFESLSLALSAILRSYGYTKESMIVTVIMNVISVCGNILALSGIFGLPITGVSGVAWAIVFARGIAVLLLLYLLFRRLSLSFKLHDIIKVNKDDYRELLSIGIPSAGESLSYQFSQLIITGMVVSFGAASLAARVYIMNISMLCFLFTLTIAMGTQLLVARYIGAKEYDKALYRGLRTLKIAFVTSLLISLAIAIIGSPLLSIFTEDPAILAVGIPVLWAIVFIEPGRAMNIVLMNSLKSAGDVRFPMIVGVIFMWGVAVVFSYILGVHFGLGLLGVWLAQGMDEWLRGLLALRRWKSRPWEKPLSTLQLKKA